MGTSKKTIETKRKSLLLLFLNIGKLMLDVTKLSFASLVLGTIIRGDFPQSTLLMAGIISSIAGATIGVTLLLFCEDK
jgi:hypothetical protein